ncbi:cobyrinic acid a,c-diamide synthase [Actinospica durhamensis]|uniref:Cobyrinic acid a,c-diamide synthase n=2 Tax=Actinospica durhamensis TaxID=1508375 RepID=A0A941EX29_9ACTN|nr:cobyrinic acid a,c-diamide synthase [Actinospica durhamensis]
MPRRVRMPGADELFGRGPVTLGNTAARLRAVPDPVEDEDEAEEALHQAPPPAHSAAPRLPASSAGSRSSGRASGRERHDEKITVYVSPEELVGLEQARIMLRTGHGLVVDRGRIVREAVNLVLADLTEHGEDSSLVRVLRTECYRQR